MSLLDSVESLDIHDRTTQLAIGAAGVLAVALYVGVIRKGGTSAATTADVVDGGNLLPAPSGDAGTGFNYFDGGGGSPAPIGGGTGTGTTPPAAKPTPLAAIFTGGKTVYERAVPDKQSQCGPGYVALMGSDGKVRCRLSDDRLRQKGQKTTYILGGGAGPAQGGQVVKETAKDPLMGGTVGGYPPFPADTTAHTSADVRDGDTLASISHRVYGSPIYWPKLLVDNPGADDLTVGDTLHVS